MSEPEPPDLRQYAPAAQRNRVPILHVLQQVLPPTGSILEISSGTGEHAVCFAPAFYPRLWIPSDPDPIARSSIAAWRATCPTDNLTAPIALDTTDSVWAVEQENRPAAIQAIDFKQHPIRAIININMIHIAPWSACLGLLAGARRILPPDGILYLYGPFKQGGQHTAISNAKFDERLQAQNPAWGVRNLDDIEAEAQAHYLRLTDVIPMPANNLSVVFQRISWDATEQ